MMSCKLTFLLHSCTFELIHFPMLTLKPEGHPLFYDPDSFDGGDQLNSLSDTIGAQQGWKRDIKRAHQAAWPKPLCKSTSIIRVRRTTMVFPEGFTMFKNCLNALHGFNVIPLQMYTSRSRWTAVELLLALACHQFAGYLLKLLIFSCWGNLDIRSIVFYTGAMLSFIYSLFGFWEFIVWSEGFRRCIFWYSYYGCFLEDWFWGT